MSTSHAVRSSQETRSPVIPADDGRAAEYAARPCAPTATELAKGTAPDPIELHVDRVSEVLMRRITIPVGGGTGWHYHPGDLLAIVEQGELAHVDARGTIHRYHPGDVFLEPHGADHVHEGHNTGGDDVVLDVTYLNPSAGPLAVPVG